MEFLIGILFVINASAFLLDRAAVRSGKNEILLDNWWIGLKSKHAPEISIEINQQFVGLFDSVYSERTWCLKRVLSSYISTMLSVFCIALVIGWEDSALPYTFESFENIFGVFLINPIIDFISLAESRWILGHMARARNSVMVLLYFVCDLLLTSCIVIVGFVLAVAILLVDFSPDIQWGVLLRTDRWGMFAISTYFTSFFIVLFTAAAFLAKLSHKLFSFTPQMFQLMASTGRPNQIVAGGASIVTIVIFAISYAI